MHLPYDQGENQHTIAVRAAALRCNKTRPAPARREPRGGERPPGRPPNAIGAIQHAGDARRRGFSPRGARVRPRTRRIGCIGCIGCVGCVGCIG
ncbi:retinal pigment epithelial membrane domain protein [Burkholderia pseudomallei]|nr:hypothetical protein AM256_06920 [Burkholderia pseudomallei]ALB99438.1 hypothetical protein AM257_06930 [Burkholderia pseudomallei]CAJ4472312.1 retinal pigment epithelial membrane domain protein [Burkholderia pseudomallei]CAJ5627140.1 retinal pigment epithelial membrane domain protein [Burkholderia pseudomallei]CAK1274000.1 Uncharacterised protein [Burkholderia pseudomallei]